MINHTTRKIDGLGNVTLSYLTIGDIRDAYKSIEDIDEKEKPTKFSNFILSRTIIEPIISSDDIDTLEAKTLNELVDFVVDSIDILDYFTQTSTELSHRERFYIAFNNHEKEYFDNLRQIIKPQFDKFYKSINKQHLESFKRLSNSLLVSQNIFEKYTLPKLTFSASNFSIPTIDEKFYDNVLKISNNIVRVSEQTTSTFQNFVKSVEPFLKEADNFTKHFSSNLAAINISFKDTVDIGIFENLIKGFKKQKDLVDACKASGWPFAPSMPTELRGKIVQLYREGKGRYISRSIIAYYEKNDYQNLKMMVCSWENNDLFQPRMHILRDALEAHCSKKYTLSVPTLIPQIEGIMNDYVHSNGLIVKLGKIKEVYEAAIGEEDEYGLSGWVIASTVLYHLQNNTYVYTKFEDEIRKPINSRQVSRHTVSHGISPNYNKKIHSLKAFLVLDAISGLQDIK